MLTDAHLKNAAPREKPYKLSDEKGLFVLVHPNGGKYFRLKYRIARKEQQLALGTYPEISLKKARELRDQHRAEIRQGIDPSAERKKKKASAIVEEFGLVSEVYQRWHSKKNAEKSATYRQQIERVFTRDILPILGHKSITEVRRAELVAVVRLVEEKGVVLAKNAACFIKMMFDFAVAEGLLEANPAVGLSGVLAGHEVKSFAATTTPAEFASVIERVNRLDGGWPPDVAALKILPHVMTRPSELRKAKWADMDLGSGTWLVRITKRGAMENIVPLSPHVIGLLTQLKKMTGGGAYVFPGPGGDGPIDLARLTRALRRAGVTPEEQTCHGFRAVGRTILDEVLGYRVDWIEHGLGHQVKDVNGRAYNRTTHLDSRRQMLNAWSDFLNNGCQAPTDSNVVSLRKAG
jgi:integrase